MREQGTQHCAELHPLAPTPSPSPFLTKSIAPPPVALSPILSRKFCIDLMVGLLHGLFYKPSYAFSLFPSRETVCTARVCCSLICFSTPLRTVDCFVQYNPVLWPTTTTPLRPPPYSCFRAPISLPALESGGSGPRLPCPQAPAAAPLQPPDMTNDP